VGEGFAERGQRSPNGKCLPAGRQGKLPARGWSALGGKVVNIPLEKTINSLISGAFLIDLAWLMAIIFLILYTVFAFIIVRQVHLLTRTLGTALSPWLKFIAWVHLVFPVLILIVVIGWL
jgi:hypothetical protein